MITTICFLKMHFSLKKHKKLIFSRFERNEKQLLEVLRRWVRFFVGSQGITVEQFPSIKLKMGIFFSTPIQHLNFLDYDKLLKKRSRISEK